MPWNWELSKWPEFDYDPALIAEQEKQFLLRVGNACAFLKTIPEQEYKRFVVEILSSEGLKSSQIEGEILDRESLQSSIKRHFGMSHKKETRKESQMANLLLSAYETFDKKLSKKMLWQWHHELFDHQSSITDLGKYRMHDDAMQIVSNRYGSSKVFFEAPPSSKVSKEMERFIRWFNESKENEPILARAGVVHIYFESIHPFEDGNGRIGRILSEKVLSQGVDRPVLIAVSKVLEKRKKEYYAALQRCNKTLKIDSWLRFFADVILQAQDESINLLMFLIEKSKMLSSLAPQLNSRQEKALLRLFSEGLEGFKGGLSAENYIAITKASRATATRDLADLVNMGALVKTGELRHTRYALNLKNFKL